VPLSEPKARLPLHRRQITLDAFRREDGLIDIESRLVDTKPFDFRVGTERPTIVSGEAIHGITVRLSVDSDSVIRECEVAMDSTPYSYCTDVSRRFDLTGIKMASGFMKAVSERIGGADNCWHVSQMLQQMATVLVQATYPALKAEIDRTPPAERAAPKMLDTCAGWQSHRPHIREEYPAGYQLKDDDVG
jgi:hypothetical protein